MSHITIEAKEASANQSDKGQNSIYFKAGMTKMATTLSRREILAVFMESPLYFTIPLRKRLELLNYFSQYHLICQYEGLRLSGKSDSKPQELIKP
jgi:hypothetical protein